MNSAQTLALLALTLEPGPGFDVREQAVFAAAARLPGIVDRVVVCSSCGAAGRAGWAPIVDLGPCTYPPLPRCWSTYNGRADGRLICGACFRVSLDSAISAMRKFARTPAGQALIEREGSDA